LLEYKRSRRDELVGLLWAVMQDQEPLTAAAA
jgi:hypothetical protein